MHAHEHDHDHAHEHDDEHDHAHEHDDEHDHDHEPGAVGERGSVPMDAAPLGDPQQPDEQGRPEGTTPASPGALVGITVPAEPGLPPASPQWAGEVSADEADPARHDPDSSQDGDDGPPQPATARGSDSRQDGDDRTGR